MDHVDSEYIRINYLSQSQGEIGALSPIEWFKGFGVFRFARLSSVREFDPSFYLEVRPEVEALSQQQRYRYWLMEGIGLGEPGCEREALDKLGLKLTSYPSEFQWRAYIMLRPEAGPNRWRAFADFLNTGFRTYAGRFIVGPTSGRLLAAMGDYYAMKSDDLAVLAYELGRKHGVLSNSNRQHLADAYLRQAMWRPALDHYRLVLSSRDATRWTVINAMKCAVQLDTVRTVTHEIFNSHVEWDFQELREILMETCTLLLRDACERAMNHIVADNADQALATISRSVRQMMEYCNTLSSRHSLVDKQACYESYSVLLVAESNSDRFRSCVGYIEEYLRAESISYQIVELSEFLAVADTVGVVNNVIAYQVPAVAEFVLGIAILKAKGASLIYATDEDLISEFAQPPLEHYAGFMWESEHVSLSIRHFQCRTAAALCDMGYAGAESLQRTLSQVIGDRPALYIPPITPGTTSPQPLPRPSNITLDIGFMCERFWYLDAENDQFAENILSALQNNERIRLIVCGPVKTDSSFFSVSERIVYRNIDDFHPDIVVANFGMTDLSEYLTYQAWSTATERGAVMLASVQEGILPFLKNGEHFIRCTDSSWREYLKTPVGSDDLESMIKNSRLVLDDLRLGLHQTIQNMLFEGKVA